MRALLALLSLALLACTGSSGDEIVWRDSRHSLAAFVPQSAWLSKNASSELPLESRELAGLQTARMRRSSCDSFDAFPAGQRWSMKYAELLKVIAGSYDIFVGRVTNAEPAWSTIEDDVVTLVHLRIEQVIRNNSGMFALGDEVIGLQAFGELVIDKQTVCRAMPKGERLANRGDLVLGFGAGDATQDRPPRLDQIVVIDESTGQLRVPRPPNASGPLTLKDVFVAVRGEVSPE